MGDGRDKYRVCFPNVGLDTYRLLQNSLIESNPVLRGVSWGKKGTEGRMTPNSIFTNQMEQKDATMKWGLRETSKFIEHTLTLHGVGRQFKVTKARCLLGLGVKSHATSPVGTQQL